jgi:hypothetical protein
VPAEILKEREKNKTSIYTLKPVNIATLGIFIPEKRFLWKNRFKLEKLLFPKQNDALY